MFSSVEATFPSSVSISKCLAGFGLTIDSMKIKSVATLSDNIAVQCLCSVDCMDFYCFNLLDDFQTFLCWMKTLSHYLLISNFAYISVQYFDNMLTQVYFYTIYLLYSSQIWLIFKGKYQNSYFAAMCKHALVIFQSCNLPRCKISICLYWTRAQGDAVILVTASVRTLARLVQWPEELLVVGWGK